MKWLRWLDRFLLEPVTLIDALEALRAEPLRITESSLTSTRLGNASVKAMYVCAASSSRSQRIVEFFTIQVDGRYGQILIEVRGRSTLYEVCEPTERNVKYPRNLNERTDVKAIVGLIRAAVFAGA